jgi:hypothetical protein
VGLGLCHQLLEKKDELESQKEVSSKKDSSEGKFSYIIDVMLHIKPRNQKNDKVEPAAIYEEGEMEVIPMLLDCVQDISSVVLVLPNDLIKFENKTLVRDSLEKFTSSSVKASQSWTLSRK